MFTKTLIVSVLLIVGCTICFGVKTRKGQAENDNQETPYQPDVYYDIPAREDPVYYDIPASDPGPKIPDDRADAFESLQDEDADDNDRAYDEYNEYSSSSEWVQPTEDLEDDTPDAEGRSDISDRVLVDNDDETEPEQMSVEDGGYAYDIWSAQPDDWTETADNWDEPDVPYEQLEEEDAHFHGSDDVYPYSYREEDDESSDEDSSQTNEEKPVDENDKNYESTSEETDDLLVDDSDKGYQSSEESNDDDKSSEEFSDDTDYTGREITRNGQVDEDSADDRVDVNEWPSREDEDETYVEDGDEVLSNNGKVVYEDSEPITSHGRRTTYTAWHIVIFAISAAIFILAILVIITVVVRLARGKYRNPIYKRLQEQQHASPHPV